MTHSLKIAAASIVAAFSIGVSGDAIAYSGEDLLSGRPFHHFDITYRALAGDAAVNGGGPIPGLGFNKNAAIAVAWHADYIDSYLYSPIFWAKGALDGSDSRLKAGFAQFDHLARLHFDDTFTTAGLNATWSRYSAGALAGLQWAAENNDYAAAYNILGVGVHAVQDFYTHSNWVDDANRRQRTWLDMTPAERNNIRIYSGAYELPAGNAPASHGKVSMDCTVFGRPEISPVMETMCTGFSPFAENPQCQNYIRHCRGGQAATVSLEGVQANAIVLAPPGIALDNSWLSLIGGPIRGLADSNGGFRSGHNSNWLTLDQCTQIANFGVACNDETPAANCPRVSPRSCTGDSDRLFATSKYLAAEATMQWVGLIDEFMSARHPEYWRQVKNGAASDVPNRHRQFEDFSQVPFQFLSAGTYPVTGTESDGYYLRMRFRTASSEGAGTDADIRVRVDYPNGSETFSLDYMPTSDANAGIRSNRLLVYNDFERGDNDVYTVGPMPGPPSRIIVTNDAADGGEVVTALAEDIWNGVKNAFNDPESTFLPIISGEADYVGETLQRLTFEELSGYARHAADCKTILSPSGNIFAWAQAAQEAAKRIEDAGGGCPNAMKINASNDGEYNLNLAISEVSGGLTAEQSRNGWKRFRITISSLYCVRESSSDRGSDSDEPFFFFSASPLNGQSSATQYFRGGPYDDVDSGETRAVSKSWDFSLSPDGLIVLAFQLYESDDESQASRNQLFTQFKTGVDSAANSSNSKFLDTLGRSVASTWTLAELDVYGFRRGPVVEAGRMLRATNIGDIGGDESRSFNLNIRGLQPVVTAGSNASPPRWQARQKYISFAPVNPDPAPPNPTPDPMPPNPGPDSAPPPSTPFNLAAAGVNPTPASLNRSFVITSMWVEGDGVCLTGRNPAGQSGPAGGARMEACTGGPDQRWTLKPTGGGYFQLQTSGTAGANLCLEGNGADASNSLGGAAFMAPCGNFSGQSWKLTRPGGDNYFHLQANSFESGGYCLEGNRIAPGQPFAGSAFRTECGDYSGQYFKFIEVFSPR